MRYDETRVNQGGLMRCCLQSLGTFVDEKKDQEAAEGEVHRCSYCKSPMVLENGVWRWQKEAVQ